MIGAFTTKIIETITGVVQPLKETLGEFASMPPDGETAGSSARQAGERNKSSSSPIRRTIRGAESYGQGFHRTGNPKNAHKIVVGGGGVRPQNNLNTPRGSSGATHQQQGYSQPRKRPRPSQPRLIYTTQGRGNPRSSPSLDLTEDADDRAAYSDDGPTNGYDLHSPRTERGPRGHAMLSPLPFESERQTDHEVLFAGTFEDTVKWARKGQGARDSEDSRVTRKRPADDDDDGRWNNPSPSDPQPTSFSRRTRQGASSPIPVGPGRPRKPEPSKSEPFLHLKSAWRGRVRHNNNNGLLDTLVIRIENKGLSVVIGAVGQPEFNLLYENIVFAAYLDDENYEFRNFIYLKVNNREHGLGDRVLLEFRALAEPANPSQKSDSARFALWLEEKGVKVEPKTHQFMKNRMEETKLHQFTRPATEASGAPWQIPGSAHPVRPIGPKPQPREVDNRLRTRSNPIPPGEDDSHPQDLEQLGTARPTRKSARNTYQKEVVEIPKPEPTPFPPQTWNATLNFPFVWQGTTELLGASSLRTLNHDEFLNDEIINFHLAYVKGRLAKENPEFARKVHITNTYFFTAFSTKTETGKFSYEKVKKWTKNANLFQKDLIFIPINEKYHWFVAVVCNLPAALAAAKAREKKAIVADELVAVEPAPKPKPAPKSRPVPSDQCTVVILDSMFGYHSTTFKAVKTYLISEAKDKQGVTLDMEDFTGLLPRKLPGQDNFSDCGIFMLHYIERWLSEPARIKEKLYERDFGSEEDARKLWSISEVTNKRERMWRLYVKLYEEYEKCLKNEAFNEFPEIIDAPMAHDKNPNKEGAGAVATDQPAGSPPMTQELAVTEDVKRPNSPAKRKSDGREDEADRPPKRAKSDSPVVVVEQPRPTVAPGLKPRMVSPEIPLSDDAPRVLEVPETQEGIDLLQRAEAPANSGVPLIAANGLIPLPLPDNPVRETGSMFEKIEQMGNFSSPPAKGRPPITPKPQADGVNTPPFVAAASDGYRAESGGRATTTHDAPPRRTVEEIEETEDESLGELPYNGRRTKGKSIHELENDRIMDTPSSQDHREGTNPPEHTEPNTPRKGTAHDPICIDSQSSPKRTSPRTKTTKATRP